MKPGDAWNKTFITYAATGGSAPADSLPLAKVRRNGADDLAVAVTVAGGTGGVYGAACVIPANYALGDRFEVLATVTMNGIVAIGVIESIVLEASEEAGDGSIAVNHDTGGTDALRAMQNGVGVGGCIVRAYLKADYDAGLRTLRGQTITGDDGRWVADLMLNALAYTLTFDAPGDALKTVEVTIAG